jgi:hypothetical protein
VKVRAFRAFSLKSARKVNKKANLRAKLKEKPPQKPRYNPLKPLFERADKVA